MKTTIKIWFSLFLFGLVFGGSSWAASSGSFLSSMATQKDIILSGYDTAYARVYQKFETSGAALMKTLNYQGLVCLGAMNNWSFLQQMQDDLKFYKVDFLNKYNTIVTSFWTLEQKQRMYQDSNVSLFTYGSYDKDLAALSAQYTEILSGHKQNLVAFQIKYEQSLQSFVSQFTTYVKKNQTFLSQITSKLALIQALDTRFSALSNVLDAHRLRVLGTNATIFSTLPGLKYKSIVAFDQSLQQIADAQIKKQRILKSLSWALLPQKSIVLSGFTQQFDSTYATFLSNWYDSSAFDALQSKIATLHSKYASGSTYNCSAILSTSGFDIEIADLVKNITQLSWSLFSGKIVTPVSSGDFQKKLSSWYTSFQSKQKSLMTSYSTFVQTTTQKMLNEYKKNAQIVTPIISEPIPEPISEPLPNEVPQGFIAPIGFSFSQPFTTNQKHSSISILQQLLQSLSYYIGPVNGIYTKDTKAAVYQFQLDQGLLKWYEKKPQTRWWMGPATRAALNKFLR